MQIRSISNLFLFSLLFSEIAFCAGGSLQDSSNRCRVLELIRMHSANEFTCRVDQWKDITGLRLRVTIRDLSVPEDSVLADRIQQQIEDQFRSSRNIILQDIQSRNYFRVIANVQIDRSDLVDELRRQGLVLPEPTEQKKEEKPEAEVISDFRQRALRPSFSSSRPVKKESARSPVSSGSKPFYTSALLETMMNTEVDLSGLDSNSTLQEALDMIRLSFDPPLPLAILWNDLQQNLLIDPETPIGIDGMTRIPLKLALELILSSASQGLGRPVVLQQDTILLIVSVQFAARQMKTHVYDIHELAAIPILIDEYSGGTGGTSYSNSGGSGR